MLYSRFGSFVVIGDLVAVVFLLACDWMDFDLKAKGYYLLLNLWSFVWTYSITSSSVLVSKPSITSHNKFAVSIITSSSSSSSYSKYIPNGGVVE